MTTLKFKCALLSDVILNQRAATEGAQSTLDFIPGGNFLGIVAAKVYAERQELALDLLHSGKVRFGDAHPGCRNQRSLRVPACFFYPKLGSYKNAGECYVHHGIPDRDLESEGLKKKQLKQCRNGFFAFDDGQASFAEAASPTFFSLKSAYDRAQRRSQDSQMFGYESLCQGLELYFAVEIDDALPSEVAELIRTALVGEKRIGRSRTAQYGLVSIATADFSEPVSERRQDDLTVVYADGRLIFFDDCDLPTFAPTAEQLGCPGGTIVWEKSQVRTFQYAPWNFKRQSRDMDRLGIEKGSVFVVKGPTNAPTEGSRYVGEFKNEGFGKVVYDPKFLSCDEQGHARYSFAKDSSSKGADGAQKDAPATPLLSYLLREHDKISGDSAIARAVNDFVATHAELWRGAEEFASQWGTIRSIALTGTSSESIIDALFKSEKGYLEHGVAADKWNDKSRKAVLQKFLNDQKGNRSDAKFKQLLVNLSSEMAKKIQEGR